MKTEEFLPEFFTGFKIVFVMMGFFFSFFIVGAFFLR